MKLRATTATFLLALPALLAWGWASPPTVDGEEVAPEGEYGTRIRWDGEHVLLLEQDLSSGGVGNTTFEVSVWTRSGLTPEGNESMWPAEDWGSVGGYQERVLDIGMFANLPDVSYSLADWAMGNERCPLDYAGITGSESTCQYFKGWMGALNSTHFPPQSYHSWSWYHQLALDTGARCVAMAKKLDELEADPASETGELIDAVKLECESEALIFEGVGHHYLQDAWSSGHIWERWGSPHPTDWNAFQGECDQCDVLHGLAVGGMAGIIHGHQSITGVPDPMCTPHEDVVFVPAGGTAADGGNIVGDYNVAEMTPEQIERLKACSRGSLDEVARVVAPLGQVGVGDGGGVAPTQEACFDHRVTNEGFVVGLLETLGMPPEDVVNTIRWLSRLRFVLPPWVNVAGEAFMLALEAVFREEATALAILTDAERWRSLHDPEGTDFAECRVNTEDGTIDFPFLGMERNSTYVGGLEDGLELHDPSAAVIAGTAPAATDKQEEDAHALRGTFHRAHTDYWCEHFDADQHDDESDISLLRSTCQQGEDEATREGACDACVEMGLRFHRVGEDFTHYDQDKEPLCYALEPDTTFLYVDADEDETQREALSDWCSSQSGWAMADNTLWKFEATGEPGALADSATDVAWVTDGAVGMAGASDRAFLSTGAGALVVVTADGVTYPFGDIECLGPRGMAYDAAEQVLYVACHDNDTVVSYDASSTEPVFLSSLDLYNDLDGGVGEEPVALALHPDGNTLAVATYETYGQRDGVTLLDLVGGEIFSGEQVSIDLVSYDSKTYPWSDFVGSFFANSAGVAWATDDTLVVSNFGKIECLGSGYESCENRSQYWVTLADRVSMEATGELKVSGRSSAVTRLWDDLVAVSLYGSTAVVIVSADDTSTPLTSIELGEYGPDSIAADKDAGRIYVALSAGGGSCGLAVIDASDEDPYGWELDTIDTSMYCVRLVDIPR